MIKNGYRSSSNFKEAKNKQFLIIFLALLDKLFILKKKSVKFPENSKKKIHIFEILNVIPWTILGDKQPECGR